MKHLSAIVWVTVIAAALALYGEHKKLQYISDELCWEADQEVEMPQAVLLRLNERIHQQERQMAELAARIQALTTDTNRLN